VRVYDEATKTLVTEMGGGYTESTSGHSNRVFSLKFHPEDENLLLSAGWDNTVHVWDVRMETSVRHLFGPHLCGDAMDIRGNTVLTGSWRPENPLELWDFRSCKRIETIPWHSSSGGAGAATKDACMLYAAQFSKDAEGSLIAAGGSGANEAKIFDRKKGNAIVGTVTGMARGVFTLDFRHDNGQIAVAGGDSSIRLIDIVSKGDGDGDEGDVVLPTTAEAQAAAEAAAAAHEATVAAQLEAAKAADE